MDLAVTAVRLFRKPDKWRWTNPLRGSRLIETTFHDFRGPVADNARPLA